MEFKQKNTKFIFIVFALIFLLIYVITTDYLKIQSYSILNKTILKNEIVVNKTILNSPIKFNLQDVKIDKTRCENINKKYIPYLNFFICLFIFILIFILVNSMPIVNALLSSICIMFLYILFALIMHYEGISIGIILPELYILVSIACAYSYRYLIEGNKKQKIQEAMGKYLSNEVMQKVVNNIDNIELGGKREDITILFADIRNFTSISETMDAKSVSMILNEYFGAVVPLFEEYNGVLNKFMGDAILAIFGDSKKDSNHALDAVKCAMKMLTKVENLKEKWLEEGKPKIEIGIGISSGEAFIGNIGSNDRLEYTVIGDTVNTANRIENYNKVYKTNILISEETYNRVKSNVDVITINNVSIRGKANKMTIYEVIRLVE